MTMRGVWGFIAVALLLLMPSHAHAQNTTKAAEDKVCVITTAKAVYQVTVDVVDTDDAREKGLMGVQYLAPDRGMLFVYDTPHMTTFWMRGTHIPLDIIFIAPDGRIAGIHRQAVPHDETPIRSPVPVLSVLEIAGGIAEKYSISKGDQVFCTSTGKGLETN